MEDESSKSESSLEEEKMTNKFLYDFPYQSTVGICLLVVITDKILYLLWVHKGILCHDVFPYADVLLVLHKLPKSWAKLMFDS